MEDLTQAVLPQEQLALCADPNRVVLQATLPEFDAQGLVDRQGHRNLGTIQIPGVDEATGCTPRASDGDAASGRPQASGRGAAGGRAQTSGAGATGGRPQAGRGGAAGSSHQAGGGSATSSGAAAASGDKGKRPRAFVPQATSSPPKDAAGDERRPEGPRLAPALEPSAPEPSAPTEPELQALPSPEPRAAAAPEPPTPTEPAPSTSRAGKMVAVRAAPPR
ncbi:predicted GPI-anchored protein 58 [Phragmites australis]|uniref:predicted GPI-anchored protein 58 n=1 Tax=Phragmites australis TaxID=29695 RepID=UPI002D77D8D5|nr:predicted GPI-anchored protein 58 [Phragmites australis]